MSGYPAPASSGSFRPRTYSLSGLLDGIFKLYRANFDLFASISLVLAVPDVIFILLGWARYSGIVRLLMAPYILATLYLATAHVMFRGPASALDILGDGLNRVGDYFRIYRRLILAALALVIPPLGIWLLVRWSLAGAVLAVEPLSPRQAIALSERLVKGAWWRSFAILVMIGVMESALAFIFTFSGGLIVLISIPGLGTSSVGTAIDILVRILTSLFIPILPIGVTLLYLDLRVRKDGIDLDLLARSAADAA